MKKKPTFKKGLARRKLHVLWSYVVRTRDGFQCQWCLYDDRKNVNKCHHAHHIVARSLTGTIGAYEVANGMTLCYHCHIDRIKSEPDEYIAFRDAWLLDRGEHYTELRAIYQGIVKFTEDWYETKKRQLERECR